MSSKISHNFSLYDHANNNKDNMQMKNHTYLKRREKLSLLNPTPFPQIINKMINGPTSFLLIPFKKKERKKNVV